MPQNEPTQLFPVEVDGKWGYMDQSGHVLIAPQYECAWDFSEGLACIQVGLLRGYIDQTGTVAIKPKFAWSGKFSGGRAAAFDKVVPWGDFCQFYMVWGGWCYVDTKGNRRPDMPIPDSFRRPPDFRDRFAKGPVPGRNREDPRFGLVGFYDRSGKTVIEPRFEEAGTFGDGLAPVAVLAKGQPPPEKRDQQWMERRKLIWGFIDQTGKMAIEPQYEEAWPFSEGLANVRIPLSSGYSTGPGQGDTGPAKWGYVDRSGAVVGKAQYDYAWPFSGGRGRILLEGKHGYVDEKGQEVIQPKFDGAWEFASGLARVILGENEWYINPKGRYVWDEAKRKVHQQLLALRLEAASGKAKESLAKYRAFLKGNAADAYLLGAGLAYLPELAGPEALDELCAAVESPERHLQEIGARAFLRLSGEGVTQRLCARTAASQEATRARYLKILGLRGDKSALATVRESLKNKDEGARLAALAALRPLAGAAAIPDLLEALKTETAAARKAACLELGQLPDKEATAALVAGLPETPAALRPGLLRLLAVREPREMKVHLGALAAEASHPEEDVRKAACGALSALGGAKELPTLIGVLVKAQRDEERAVAEGAAVELIAKCGKDLAAGGLADTCAAPAVDALAAAPPPARPSLLRVLGKIGGAKAFAAVEAETKEQDAGRREEAVRALLAWPDGAATEAVLAIAKEPGDEALRELARRGFIRLLGLPVKREPGRAFELCGIGMEMAKDLEEKKRILACLGSVRLLDALKALAPHLENEALRNDAATALVNAGSGLWGAHPKEVKAYMEQLTGASFSKNTQQAARNLLAEIGKYEGFITAWTVAGPYSKDGIEAKKLLEEVFPPESAEFKEAEWNPLPAALRGWNLDLTKVFNRTNCVAYLRVVLESQTAQPAILELGSSAGVKVWLNGEVVHSKNVIRAVKPGEDKVKVSLKAGPNLLLLKISRGASGGWGACACLRKPEGAILVLQGAE